MPAAGEIIDAADFPSAPGPYVRAEDARTDGHPDATAGDVIVAEE